MPTYCYRAIAADSSIQAGRLTAASEDALERTLGLRGLALIEARASFSLLPRAGTRRSLGDNDLRELTYLLILVNASGVPILEGLNDVVTGREKVKLMPAVEALVNGLQTGMSLSGVMRAHPEFFPAYYAQVVNAGEVSGTLDQGLRYLMSYLDWQIDFRRTINAFFRYPLIILALMGLLAGILFSFVFPSLAKVLSGLGVALPLPTRVIFSTAEFVHGQLPLLLTLGILVPLATYLVSRTGSGRLLIDRALLQVPLVGNLIRKINLSRYFKTLATLLAAGLDIQKAFATAAEVAGNMVLRQKLIAVTNAITTGEGVSSAMRATMTVQPLVISMIVIGEKTGNLDGALVRASEIFDKEVPETIKKVFALLEPLTIILLGALLLIILLSIFLPIYSVIGNLRVR